MSFDTGSLLMDARGRTYWLDGETGGLNPSPLAFLHGRDVYRSEVVA